MAKFVISGAAGQIGTQLIPLVCSGQVLGPNTPLTLVLFDIPRAEKALEGIKMEIQDCAYDLVTEVICATTAAEALKGATHVILVGGFPRGPGMVRADLLGKNKPIFVEAGKALNDSGDPNVKVLVVANPANSNCLVCLKNAPKLSRDNFSALTRLDHNRAIGQLALKAGVPARTIKNIAIWGNHSKTLYPDASTAVTGDDNIVQKINDDEWLNGEFIKNVQYRGAEVIKMRGVSSAISAANAAKDQMRDWVQGTKDGEIVSMAVLSDGEYGIAKDIVYSFPVTCKDGKFTVQQGRALSKEAMKRLKATEAELLKEKEACGLCKL